MVHPTGRSAQMIVGVCLGLLELFPAVSMALISLIGILLVAKTAAGIISAKLLSAVARHRHAMLSRSGAIPLGNGTDGEL